MSTVMSSMVENGLATFEGRSESALRVKADLNCLLQMLALFFTTVSPSEVFLKFQMAKFMLRIGISRAVIHECKYIGRHLSIPSVHVL